MGGGARQRRAPRVPGLLVEVEAELHAFFQCNSAVYELAYTQFGPLQIGDNADGHGEFFFDVADELHALAVIFMGAVRKIKAENIDPFPYQRPQHILGTGGRADCGHYFSFVERSFFKHKV